MQRDVAAITGAVDLLALIGADTPLRRTCGTGGGEWHGPCPFCGGRDRFMVQPHAASPHWRCRQCSPKPSDAIDYLRRRDGLSFTAACDQLGGAVTPPQRERKEPTMTMQHDPRPPAPPPPAWQGAALALLELAEAALWAPSGASARDYLGKRGLSEDTIRGAHLGYVAKDARAGGLTCPAGIVIPWFYRGDCWQLKVRRRSGSEPKYLAVTGGHPYLFVTPAGLPADGPLVLTEGEFDALLLSQEVRGLVAVASLGSNTTGAAGLPAGLDAVLRRYDPVFLAYDNDPAGRAGVAALSRVIPGSKRLPVPDGKDVTEFWQRGGRLRDWVEAYLARLTLLDTARADESAAVAAETHEKPAWQCDMPGCTEQTYVDRDPETGGFCVAHSRRWQLLNLASLIDWPQIRVGITVLAGSYAYRSFALSAEDQAIAAAYAAVDGRVPALAGV